MHPSPQWLWLLSVLRWCFGCCWLLLPFWDSVIVLCFVVRYIVSILVCNHLYGEERTGCYALFVFLVSRDCSRALSHDAKCLSAVCDCGISWSYSLCFFIQCTGDSGTWEMVNIDNHNNKNNMESHVHARELLKSNSRVIAGLLETIVLFQ